MREDAIQTAIDRCYDAVFLPDTWPDALHRLARAHDAACTMFYPRNPDRTSSDPRASDQAINMVPASPDYGDLLREYAANRWYLGHYRALRGFPLLDSGCSVVIEHDLATDQERKTLRHYNELYLAFGFPGFAMLGFDVGGMPWAMPFLRGVGQGDFTPYDAKRLLRLIPHVRRMIRLMEKLVARSEALGLSLFDELQFGAVLVDDAGRVLNLNHKAEKLVRKSLKLRLGKLSANDPASDVRLQRFIAEVSSRADDSVPAPISVRGEGCSPLRIDAILLKGVSAEIFGRGRALLIVEGPQQGLVAPPRFLEQTLNLTPAQAKLAYHIGSGMGLREASGVLGISYETARSTLKLIFLRTDTHRQSEIVALVEQAKARIGRH